MEEQKYYFKVSPENVKRDIVTVTYVGNTEYSYSADPCCSITSVTSTTLTGFTGVYSGMSQILSGGTNGQSLLTGLTIPILLTEVATDIGYYSVFDGAILQKEVITNFLFSATTGNPYTFFFFNTSDTEFKKFLSVSTYTVDWGDGSQIQNVTSPIQYNHVYPVVNQTYTITLKATSPWGISIVKKTVTVPFTNVPIFNPNGTAFFTPAGGSWANTSFNYDYIYTGDSNTNVNDYISSNYTTVPFVITGFTQSNVNDLVVYGPKYALYGGKFKVGIQVTGTSQSVGTYWGPDPTNTYTAYTINDILYYDYNDGTTVYVVESSGFTQNDLILSAITKNEALLNVIDQPEIQTDVYVERGKNSALEYVERLGEVDNVGDLEKYGYGFFKVEKQ
jgi:hypothetical protein